MNLTRVASIWVRHHYVGSDVDLEPMGFDLNSIPALSLCTHNTHAENPDGFVSIDYGSSPIRALSACTRNVHGSSGVDYRSTDLGSNPNQEISAGSHGHYYDSAVHLVFH